MITYKYNFWQAIGKQAPSQEEQERLFFKLATDMGITVRQLKKYLSIKASEAKDMPATAFVWLAARLGVKPEQAVNYKLPATTMLDEMTKGTGIKSKFNLTK